MLHVVVELTIVHHRWCHGLIMILTMTVHHSIEQAASIDVAILKVDCCLPDVCVILTPISNVRVVFHLPQVEGETLTPFKEERHAVAISAVLDNELRAFRSMGSGEGWSRARIWTR